MKRIELELDDSTYELLRQQAAGQDALIPILVREVLQEYLKAHKSESKGIQDFKFIASGRSKKSKFDPISERHDEALDEDMTK